LFDYVLVNSAPISSSARKRYLAQQSQPVSASHEALERMGVKVIEADFVAEKLSGSTPGQRVRHHPDLLAKAVLNAAMAHHASVGSEAPEIRNLYRGRHNEPSRRRSRSRGLHAK
jgi:hypothetical protein